ncbi:MAG: hypothetical protein ACUVQ0_06235 [Thermoproteota archaeon]
MRILEGEEKSVLISRIMKTDDYKIVAANLGELGLEPLFEEAWAVEVLEARNAILTRLSGVSVAFLRKSDSFSLIAIFILEPYAKSLVYELQKDEHA